MSFLQNKKILVTGADGFIGSHLVEYLINQGYQVKAFCFYNSFYNEKDIANRLITEKA